MRVHVKDDWFVTLLWDKLPPDPLPVLRSARPGDMLVVNKAHANGVVPVEWNADRFTGLGMEQIHRLGFDVVETQLTGEYPLFDWQQILIGVRPGCLSQHGGDAMVLARRLQTAYQRSYATLFLEYDTHELVKSVSGIGFDTVEPSPALVRDTAKLVFGLE